MYRVLQGNIGSVADATFKAGVALKRGMFVVKGTNGEVDFPETATDKNVFIVGGEFVATGANGERDLPDYSDEFENIAQGQAVVLEKPIAPGVYWTDQITGTLTAGGYATVGTDGKLCSSENATKFLVTKVGYSDSGRTASGVVIEVLD